jgi:hypothetical protein
VSAAGIAASLITLTTVEDLVNVTVAVRAAAEVFAKDKPIMVVWVLAAAVKTVVCVVTPEAR